MRDSAFSLFYMGIILAPSSPPAQPMASAMVPENPRIVYDAICPASVIVFWGENDRYDQPSTLSRQSQRCTGYRPDLFATNYINAFSIGYNMLLA
jgi:hypothetical protein